MISRIFSPSRSSVVISLVLICAMMLPTLAGPQTPPPRKKQSPPSKTSKDDSSTKTDKSDQKDSTDKKDENTDNSANNSDAIQEIRPNSTLDVTKLRLVLDGLADDAKGLPFNTRPFALADVADAYCHIDQPRALQLYKLAVDAATGEKGNLPYGRSLARSISARASECFSPGTRAQNSAPQRTSSRSTNNRNDRRNTNVYVRPNEEIDIDFDALETDGSDIDSSGSLDPQQMETFIEKAEVDRASSDNLYRFYLSRFAAYPGVRIYQLDQLLYLAGYPFGRSESWGFPLDLSSASTLIGYGGSPIPNFDPDPQLAAYFIEVALQNVQVAFQILQTAPLPERDIRIRIILFTLEYLIQDVARYRPRLNTIWRQLYAQALALTTPAQQQIVASWIQYIGKFRGDNETERAIAKLDFNSDLDNALSKVSQLPVGCSRDRLYARIALSDATPDKADRMLTISQDIEDASMRDIVQQAIYYNTAKAIITSGDLSGVSETIERITNPQERALLYILLARRTLRGEDQNETNISLNEVQRLAADNWDSKDKAAVLLAAATVYARFDLIGLNDTFGEAIKTINQTKGENIEALSISRKVASQCAVGVTSLIGNIGPEAHVNLYDTALSIASYDFDGAMLQIGKLDDAATRIRTAAYIVKLMVVPASPRKPRAETQTGTTKNQNQ